MSTRQTDKIVYVLINPFRFFCDMNSCTLQLEGSGVHEKNGGKLVCALGRAVCNLEDRRKGLRAVVIVFAHLWFMGRLNSTAFLKLQCQPY